MIALAWILFVAVIFVTILGCFLLVRYYIDKHENEKFTLIVATLGISLALFCIFLIPVDIYNVSSSLNSHGHPIVSHEEIKARSESIRITYYVLYSFILFFSFGLIPFAYFYFEEGDDDTTLRQRIWGGCKYTIFVILIVVVLLIVGLFLSLAKVEGKPAHNEHSKEWVKKFSSKNVLADAINFSMASLTLIGYCVLILYTSYGLSSLPFSLIRGKKHIAEDFNSINEDLAITKEKARVIESKYLGKSKSMNKKDSASLALLKRKERVLSRQEKRLEQSVSGWRKIIVFLRPFFFLFGIVFYLLTLLIVSSILLTSIDKAVNSGKFCGAKCGFVIAYPQIFNPLDTMFTKLAEFFPLDYIILGGLIIYFYFATLSGITKIGIRFLWIRLYKIRPRASPPQSLLCAALIMMLALMALNMEITTLAPQYANWGSQVYFDAATNQTKSCSLEAPPGICTMTQIGTFVSRISVQTSFFGVLFFIGTWLFLLLWLVGTIIAFVKSRTSNIVERESDSEEDE